LAPGPCGGGGGGTIHASSFMGRGHCARRGAFLHRLRERETPAAATRTEAGREPALREMRTRAAGPTEPEVLHGKQRHSAQMEPRAGRDSGPLMSPHQIGAAGYRRGCMSTITRSGRALLDPGAARFPGDHRPRMASSPGRRSLDRYSPRITGSLSITRNQLSASEDPPPPSSATQRPAYSPSRRAGSIETGADDASPSPRRHVASLSPTSQGWSRPSVGAPAGTSLFFGTRARGRGGLIWGSPSPR
jgi:hypothetical protein